MFDVNYYDMSTEDFVVFCLFRFIINSTKKNLDVSVTLAVLLPQMCLHWLTQCFWNYLDWPEICHYISTCVLMGPDYQVYMCVAVFKHLQPDILQRTQSQELQVFLKVRLSTNTQKQWVSYIQHPVLY